MTQKPVITPQAAAWIAGDMSSEDYWAWVKERVATVDFQENLRVVQKAFREGNIPVITDIMIKEAAKESAERVRRGRRD